MFYRGKLIPPEETMPYWNPGKKKGSLCGSERRVGIKRGSRHSWKNKKEGGCLIRGRQRVVIHRIHQNNSKGSGNEKGERESVPSFRKGGRCPEEKRSISQRLAVEEEKG